MKNENTNLGAPLPQDEKVDFEPLIGIFIKGINFIVNRIKGIWHRGWSRKSWLVIGGFLGMVTGLLIYFFAPKVYYADLTLRAQNIDNTTCFRMIQNIGQLAYDKSSDVLAEQLEISEDVAEEIKFINYLTLNGEEGSSLDSIPLKQDFMVVMECYSNDHLSDIENAIVEFLENNKYGIELKETRKIYLEAVNKKITTDLKALDSLKKTVEASIIPRSESKGIIIGDPINPISIYSESERLYSSLLVNEGQLSLMSNIKVVKSFIPLGKPVFPRMRVVIFALLSGVAFMFIIAQFFPKKQA